LNDEPSADERRRVERRRARRRRELRRRRRRSRLGVAAILLGLALAGGSLRDWLRPLPGDPAVANASTSEAIRSFLRRGRPVRIAIPAIRVSAPIVPLGLNPDGTLAVPADFGVAGWYVGSSTPGARGPAVIVGHLDSTRGPAVFYRLRSLRRGERVTVRLAGGAERHFVVLGVIEYAKARFPTRAVYGPAARPSLRLVTCGGPFDFATHHYRDNVVVYARLTRV
jgi:hypothetical protein